jgi:hypothetical protein
MGMRVWIFKELRPRCHNSLKLDYRNGMDAMAKRKSGHQCLQVMACVRNEILLGRDICKEIRLGSSWLGGWFGVRDRQVSEDALRSYFQE